MELIYTLEDIDHVAAQVLAFAKTKTIILDAPMGSGKTTLISAMCKQLGVTEAISSPTFSIVNEYKGKGCEVLHFDLYRLNDPLELLNIGFEDYLYRQTAYIFIEWPEISIKMLGEYNLIRILTIQNRTRKLVVS